MTVDRAAATSRSGPYAMPSLAGTAPGLFDYTLLVVIALIWGSSFMFQKIALADVGPAFLTFVRLVAATAFIAPVAIWAGQRLRLDARSWLLVGFAGFVGNTLPFALIAWGQERVEAGTAAILLGLMPLITVLLGHVLTRDETITARRLTGVLVGFGGLVVLIGPLALAGVGSSIARELAILMAAVCYAINVFVTRRLTDMPRYALIAVMLGISAMLAIPALAFEGLPTEPSMTSLGICVMLGVVQTAIPALLLFIVIRRQGAVFFGQVNLIVPLTGVAWAFVFLGERPDLNAWIALILIIAGVAVSRRPAPAERDPA